MLGSVLKSGLLLAAVATGSSAMPSNEPSPVSGTAEQAEPSGAAISLSSPMVVLESSAMVVVDSSAGAAVV